MVVDGIDYAVRGMKETEEETGESEIETTFIVTLSDTRSMYVEQSAETEGRDVERSYEYSVREGKTVIEACSFEYERESGDETEIEFHLWSRGENGNTSQIFYFEQDERENGAIRIRVGDKNSSQVYTVRIVNNGDGTSRYVYEYGGRTYEKDRR